MKYTFSFFSYVIGQWSVRFGATSWTGDESEPEQCTCLLRLSQTRHQLLYDVRCVSLQVFACSFLRMLFLCKTKYFQLHVSSYFLVYSGCDSCNEWFHGDCIHISEKTAKTIRVWYCEKCRSKEIWIINFILYNCFYLFCFKNSK